MSTSVQAPSSFRRAVLLMTASSFLVPAAGIVTAPVLARGLSTVGRGELAAALAPALLMLSAATLGLPDALTYHIAKDPRLTRPALLWASLITLALGLVCLIATFAALPFLSGGNPHLGRLIFLATALTVPALVGNVLRGAATGRQMWTAVAVERLINTVLRVVGFGLLFVAGDLTVIAAVIVSCAIPLVAAVVYWPLLRRPRAGTGDVRLEYVDVEDATPLPTRAAMLHDVMSFGSKVWLGSVASMLLARAGQLLMTPLSSVRDLGLFSVATTVSDLPLIVALAIQGALFGVNSKARDAQQVAATARLTLLVAGVGVVVMGGTLPFWLPALFGAEFADATVPTLMLLLSALLCIPGLMAATGLSAWGRPGVRSLGLLLTLIANVTAFIVLVPPFGVYGAAWTSLLSNVVMTGFMVTAARGVMGLPARDFLVIRRSDVARAWSEGISVLAYLKDAADSDATAGDR